MAFDSQRDCTVLFGGGWGTPLADTWEWDGATWAPRVFVAGPPARSEHAMSYDHRGRTVLFGGMDHRMSSTILGDTWEWDGSAWLRRATTGPPARLHHAMVHDRQRARTLLFGGWGAAIFTDTWEWDGSTGTTAATATAFGSGCGDPALTLVPDASGRPVVNTTAHVVLTNIPSGIAFVGLGWNRTLFGPFPLPLLLASFGMPGCDLLQSADAPAEPVTLTSVTTADYRLPLPNVPALVGTRLYLQAWAVAPNANPGHTIVSNGVEWCLGDR